MDEAVLIALTTLIGVFVSGTASVVAAIFVRRSGKEVAQINDAVNHRHERGPDALKLYDLLWETHGDGKELIEWKRTYDNGPLDNGTKTKNFVDETNSRIQAIEKTLDLKSGK